MLPELDTQEPYQTLAPKAWDALKASNSPPRFFLHGSVPTRIETNERSVPALEPLTVDRMSHAVGRSARWYKRTRSGRVAAEPSLRLVRDMLAEPAPPLPGLTRIVEAPVFASDGSLQTQPGYQANSRTYYTPAAGLVISDVPERPTLEDVARARHVIVDELLGEFPFAGDSERAHAVELLLLPFARELIGGPTPLHLIEKPSPGTGAGLLADVLLMPALGHSAAVMTEARDEDEWRKRITARLLAGANVIVLDNLQRRLDSAALSAALTASIWEDRILGLSRTASIPLRTVWVATANNPSLSMEMARRAVRIRLDAQVDRPWLRAGFRHSDLRGWACRCRGQLIGAALTLIRAWIVAGRTRTDGLRLGGFEAWSETMGGILAMAGVEGFLSNVADLYAMNDEESRSWRQLVEAWHAMYHYRPVGVAELWLLVERGGFGLELGAGSDRSQRTRFGLALSKMRDRQFDGWRICAAPSLMGAQRYRLEAVNVYERSVNVDVNVGEAGVNVVNVFPDLCVEEER